MVASVSEFQSHTERYNMDHGQIASPGNAMFGQWPGHGWPILKDEPRSSTQCLSRQHACSRLVHGRATREDMTKFLPQTVRACYGRVARNAALLYTN